MVFVILTAFAMTKNHWIFFATIFFTRMFAFFTPKKKHQKNDVKKAKKLV